MSLLATLQSRLGIVATSAVMLVVLECALTYAKERREAVVLITGDTGTGKTLVAEFIHEAAITDGDGPHGRFVSLNCAKLRAENFESVICGHLKGAFTGADNPREGALRAAAGGTLFLDEIGELDPDGQALLLKIIDERRFTPMGADRSQPVTCRIIAATNRDMAGMVRTGTFREDLLYRIASHPLEMPALHERPEDIAMIAAKFLTLDEHRDDWRLDARALSWLQAQPYDGGLRQLRNVLDQARLQAADTAPLITRSAVKAGWEVTARVTGHGRGVTLESGEHDAVESYESVVAKLSEASESGWWRSSTFGKAIGVGDVAQLTSSPRWKSKASSSALEGEPAPAGR